MDKEEIRIRLEHAYKHAHKVLELAKPLESIYSQAYPIEAELAYILQELHREEADALITKEAIAV